jgi:hypothetical protein
MDFAQRFSPPISLMALASRAQSLRAAAYVGGLGMGGAVAAGAMLPHHL